MSPPSSASGFSTIRPARMTIRNLTWGDTTGVVCQRDPLERGEGPGLNKGREKPGRGPSRRPVQIRRLRAADPRIQVRLGIEWLVRLESPMPPDWSKPVVYPEGTVTAASTQAAGSS
ncbi:MAG: hypothetical protein MZV63_46785 [Marinilabiliales bacterium]|nr:hypothetical protein [Marinilabiliales bacterium]